MTPRLKSLSIGGGLIKCAGIEFGVSQLAGAVPQAVFSTARPDIRVMIMGRASPAPNMAFPAPLGTKITIVKGRKELAGIVLLKHLPEQKMISAEITH